MHCGTQSLSCLKQKLHSINGWEYIKFPPKEQPLFWWKESLWIFIPHDFNQEKLSSIKGGEQKKFGLKDKFNAIRNARVCILWNKPTSFHQRPSLGRHPGAVEYKWLWL